MDELGGKGGYQRDGKTANLGNLEWNRQKG
jgi:hypothetical protein